VLTLTLMLPLGCAPSGLAKFHAGPADGEVAPHLDPGEPLESRDEPAGGGMTTDATGVCGTSFYIR
jgi:hypothetical protein